MKALLASTKPDADGLVASAALSGPAMLSGLEQNQFEHVRLAWANERHREEVARLGELEKGRRSFRKRGEIGVELLAGDCRSGDGRQGAGFGREGDRRDCRSGRASAALKTPKRRAL